MSVIGIDPGLTGALALYDPLSGSLDVADMPVHRIGSKTVVDHYGLARIVDDWGRTTPHCWIEFVSSSPQMGVASAFKFGETVGVIRGVCAASFLPIETVTPPTWRKAMGVKGDKDESRARACALFPKHSGLFSRKKDDGRAEAVLIAAYGARLLHARAA